MNKSVFIVTLFVVMHEVQLQRSPYAGSTNRFRGQPMNLVLGTAATISASPVSQTSVPPVSTLPVSQANVPSFSASPVSQTSVAPVSTLPLSQESVPSISVSRASFPSVSTLPVSQDRIITVQQSATTNMGKIPQVFTPSRFSNDYYSNRHFDEHRNFYHLHGKRDFDDSNEYDY